MLSTRPIYINRYDIFYKNL